jgi:hypothetical protein
MSTFGSANAVDKVGFFKGSNDLLQVFHRNILALGHIANLDRPLTVIASQVHQQSGSVSAFSGKFHCSRKAPFNSYFYVLYYFNIEYTCNTSLSRKNIGKNIGAKGTTTISCKRPWTSLNISITQHSQHVSDSVTELTKQAMQPLHRIDGFDSAGGWMTK